MTKLKEKVLICRDKSPAMHQEIFSDSVKTCSDDGSQL